MFTPICTLRKTSQFHPSSSSSVRQGRRHCCEKLSLVSVPPFLKIQKGRTNLVTCLSLRYIYFPINIFKMLHLLIMDAAISISGEKMWHMAVQTFSQSKNYFRCMQVAGALRVNVADHQFQDRRGTSSITVDVFLSTTMITTAIVTFGNDNST